MSPHLSQLAQAVITTQTRWLREQKFSSSLLWKIEVKIRIPAWLLSEEGSFWLTDGHLLTYFHMTVSAKRKERERERSSFSCKDTVLTDKGPTLMTSFNLKDSISRYRYHQGLKLQHMNLGRINFSVQHHLLK